MPQKAPASQVNDNLQLFTTIRNWKIDSGPEQFLDKKIWQNTYSPGTATLANTKLLLVTDETVAPGASRPLTEALAEGLSWSHYIGTPPAREVADSALTRVSRYLSDLSTPPDDEAHREAAALLARRDALAASYTRLAAPLHLRAADREGPQRDTGLSL